MFIVVCRDVIELVVCNYMYNVKGVTTIRSEKRF